ncbi:MAG TPA: FG-GAP repeat protein, partial [Desulfobacteraceae bacterium]|nr:FG-GAP repeat protein [Desulfobacteraceae bacterium]
MKKNYVFLAGLVLFAVLISQTAFSNTILPGEKQGLTGFDYLVKGAEREVELATAMTTGDFNGDGVMDIAVGSTRAGSPRGIEEAGAVSVFFGGTNFNALPATLEAIADEKEDVLLYGGSAQEYAGEFLASGDLNGDGIDDLVIAAQQIKDTGAPVDAKEAKIYIVYGGASLSGNISLASKADVVIQRKDSMHAEDIVIADFNGDATDDILITDILTDDVKHPPVAPRIEGEPRGVNGAVYLILGGGLNQTVNPTEDAKSTIMRNTGEDVFQVYSMAAGDFNNDGQTDIALGAPGEDCTSPELSETGKVYLILDAQNLNGDVDIETLADVVITGALENDQIGGKLAACDFNNDGVDDVIIGAPLSGWGEAGTTGKGKVQVVFGAATLNPAMDLYEDNSVDLQLSSDSARIGFKTGMEILGTDINGDGVDDLVISSPNAFTKAGTNGWVHVVFGSSSP